jgi:catechol 2,3-dioxygenase-like lactoylglutathione lyase family enzyme
MPTRRSARWPLHLPSLVRCPGVPPVHHLAFRSRDLDALAAFYATWLGAAVVRDSRPRALWLELGPGAVLMLELAGPDEPVLDPRSLELVAFRIEAVERAALRTRLSAAGLLEAETEHTLYLRDPDGRRIAFSSYPL